MPVYILRILDKSQTRGINPRVLGHELNSSNLIMNDEVTWVTFHGQYDFSYLMKVILAAQLPDRPTGFLDYLEMIFPVKYDIKMMINEMEEIKNFSLQKLGNDLCIERHGRQHQGGSDALLTLGKLFLLFFWSFNLEMGIMYGIVGLNGILSILRNVRMG